MTTPSDILGRPPMRKPPQRDDSADAIPIEELAAPLSAKVMPRSAMYSMGGSVMTEEGALHSQRKTKYRPRPVKPKAKK